MYNQYVHQLAHDAKMMLEALKHVQLTEASDEDSAVSDADDDASEFDGKSYYYHPPKIGNRVRVLWELTPSAGSDIKRHFFEGIIYKKIKKNGKSRYAINYDDGTYDEDYLNIADFPMKWNFVIQ
tara:strand:+ start:619 stop:993 length:375 start_codon:yes stop_codon:yes gene_type:complete